MRGYSMDTNKIDFVITWGSNDDPEWRKQREYYSLNDHFSVRSFKI